MSTMLRLSTCLALAMAGMGTAAAAPPAQRASLELTGSITVGADGRPLSYHIDHRDEVQPEVQHLVDASIARWRFAPQAASATMSLRLVADGRADGKFEMKVDAVSFGSAEERERVVYKDKRRTVVYPRDLIDARVEGLVLVLVEIGEQGEVVHADAERVDLGRTGSAYETRIWRRDFAMASVNAIRHWTFKAPASGPAHRYAVLPVQFDLNRYTRGGTLASSYGKWHLYYPGRRQLPEWYQPAPGQSIPDVVPAGSLASLQPSLQLLTSPQGS